jgi:hypothetical protein
MTTISAPGAPPPVQGEFRKLDKAVAGRRFLVALGISALALTALNLTAAVYLLRATSQLRAMDTRMQDLAGLEKRLKSSLEIVNTGIQSQVETLNRDVHDQITELEDGVGELQRQLDHARVATAALPEPEVTAPTTVSVADPMPDVAEEADVPVADIAPPKRRKRAEPPVSKVGSSYQRTESPDGKVYYRRVH